MNVTRILVLSDLHLEFFPIQPPDPDLAGDIAAGLEAVNWSRLHPSSG